MIDELRSWGHLPPLIVADAGYGEVTPFRLGLTARALAYVVAVKLSTSVLREGAVPAVMDYTGRGSRPRQMRYQDALISVKEAVTNGGRDAFTEITRRRGVHRRPSNPTAAMTSHFVSIRVRPANRNVPRADDGTLPVQWLIAEWPDNAEEPTDYWLATLPDHTPLAELVRLAKIRWRIEHDYRELKHGLGLDHFEGRCWLGWHHHATLVTAAYLFITQLQLTRPNAHGTA